MKKEKMYYDPEYDRMVPESVIKSQYEWFKKNMPYCYKSYDEFKKDNFQEV